MAQFLILAGLMLLASGASFVKSDNIIGIPRWIRIVVGIIIAGIGFTSL